MAGIVAGPVGREASASTTPLSMLEFLSYIAQQGCFHWLALKVRSNKSDTRLNEAVYGMKATRDVDGKADDTWHHAG